jgi:hypothetical protein
MAKDVTGGLIQNASKRGGWPDRNNAYIEGASALFVGCRDRPVRG